MKRREFLGVLGGVAATWPAAAQPSKLPVVALVLGVAPLAGMSGADPAIPFVRAFVQGLGML